MRSLRASKEDPRERIITFLPDMRAFAQSLTRNETAADDLLQDAVIKAWKNFHQFRTDTNLRAWLFTIVRNTFYTDLRRKRRELHFAEDSWLHTAGEAPSSNKIIAVMDFEKAFFQLPDEQREALILVGASGLSYEEAAETCGVAMGTIKSRINRGRKRLAEIMAGDEDGPPPD
ncbi:sigma-70 family RNA polymerase sigma factor [Yoonia sp. 2307UL14-13]|uniref:sigma-70 family RNA polymerase sigma factor n=1 Tax=Yoonia sp. 2307UL14-13 TaxID=3126506 RepID=UPI0030AA9383